MCLVLQTKRNGRGKYYIDKSKALNPKVKAMTEGFKVVAPSYGNGNQFVNELVSPFKGTTVWKPGVVNSNRSQTALTSEEKSMGTVYFGIHLFLSRKVAQNWAVPGENVLRVKVDPRDFVACNTNSKAAVYQKVTVTKKDYNKTARKTFPQAFHPVEVKVMGKDGKTLSRKSIMSLLGVV